jgi:hypothetical protein
MSINLYELEKEMNRRQCDIERTRREAWKFQGRHREIKSMKRGLKKISTFLKTLWALA